MGTTPGSTGCTDNCVAEIIRAETGRNVTPAAVRSRTLRANRPCLGLRPQDALMALVSFGVRGYKYTSGVTVDDVFRATERGIVLVGVGYRLYPRLVGEPGPGPTAEYGGKTDTAFRGSHAITVWGRRTWTKKPAAWPKGRVFVPGTRVWTRDPDHRQEWPLAYDRISKSQLADAMRALVTDTAWQSTFMIAK